MSSPSPSPSTSLSTSPLADAKRPVYPAKLSSSSIFVKAGYLINQLCYKVPIDHRPKDGKTNKTILITVRVVLGHSSAEDGNLKGTGVHLNPIKPIAVYLVGGPGSNNPPTAHPALNDFYLAKGFQIMYMDYRGTGSSHLLRADELSEAFGNSAQSGGEPILQTFTPQEQADHLALFRQDNIVRDLEAVRKSLQNCGIQSARKWTLVGQSYGGWVSFSYLSLYPQSLQMVIVTGGIPPVGQTADAVYKNTYKTLIKACDTFYGKFPHHEATVRDILEFIARQRRDRCGNGASLKMPGGGVLTPERFLCLGRTLGTTDGDAKVDRALVACLEDVQRGRFSEDTLRRIESWLRFEERPLYALLHEAIYTEPGMAAASWSAERTGKMLPQYWWLEQGAFDRVFSGLDEDAAFRKEHFDGKRIYMSGEHVYRFHFDQHRALLPLKKAAEILAKKDDWPLLFDAAQLALNEVPISSLSYDLDMFIDWELSQSTVVNGKVKNIVVEHDGKLMHTAVKDRSHVVLPLVWKGLVKAVGNKAGRVLSEEEGLSAQSLIAPLEGGKKST
ncbi:MAG: hypothetical protein STHCBS139747_002792 [Sporothrix thermara]